jgi:Tfp pilus assembly PilM family ATPase
MSFIADWLSLRDAPPPAAAVEIAAHHVAAATIDVRGGRPVVASHAAEALPPGAIVPALAASNLRDRPAVADALARVLDEIGRPRKVGLIVPDPVAKVSLVRFAHVPPRRQDLDQLIRWQVRKAAPFSIDEAQVSYVPGLQASDGREFVVTLAKREVINEYEALAADCGAHAGIVDLSTFNVINAALVAAAPPAGDWLLVNVASDYASIAILRGGHLMFFRSRAAEGEGTLADLVHQTAMYYEDRLQGGGFERIMLSGASVHEADVDEIHRSLQERLGMAVEAVNPGAAAAFSDRIMAAPSFLDTIAPLVGLLMRGREAA